MRSPIQLAWATQLAGLLAVVSADGGLKSDRTPCDGTLFTSQNRNLPTEYTIVGANNGHFITNMADSVKPNGITIDIPDRYMLAKVWTDFKGPYTYYHLSFSSYPTPEGQFLFFSTVDLVMAPTSNSRAEFVMRLDGSFGGGENCFSELANDVPKHNEDTSPAWFIKVSDS